MIRRVALVSALAAAFAAGTASAQSSPPPCGLAKPVDQLLGCSDDGQPPAAPSAADEEPETTASTTSGQSESGQSESGQSESTRAVVQAARPVRRVPRKPRYVSNRLLVEFVPGASRARIASLLAGTGASLEESIGAIGVKVLHVPPARRDQVLRRLNASPLVAAVERDVVYDATSTVPNDEIWSYQWGLQRIGLPQAWDVSRGSAGVVVAVVDTGVAAGHPDLEGAVLAGHDFVNGDDDASDDNGHGTAVAGVIAARTNNAMGQAGVCWTCSILPVKVLDSDGSGDMAALAQGLVYAADHGARVINISLGGPGGSDTLQQAVDYATARGAAVIAAAGNNGTTEPFYPAALPGVLSVAGTDEQDGLYSWSNRGSWVRVAAPGCDVATMTDGGYGDFCGTSAATPVVSGLAALAASANPNASAATIVGALESAARAKPASGVADGRVDAPGTLTAVGAAVPPAAPVASQQPTVTFTGQITPRDRMKTFAIATGRGEVTATLRFDGGPLTLKVGGSSKTGASPIELTRRVRAGATLLKVTGRKKTTASFSLTVTYPAVGGS